MYQPEKNKDKSFRITVEPVVFSFVFAATLSDGVVTNLLLRQACRNGGFDSFNCTGNAQIRAQQLTSYVEIAKMLIESILPSILSFFIGPWSDANGRKIILIAPVIGYAITYTTWGILSFFTNLHPVYFLLCSIGAAFSGGLVTITIACICYLADITEAKDRGFRLGIIEGCINGAQLIGYFLTPYIFGSTKDGYWVIFFTNALLLTINVFYIIIFIPETVEKIPERNKKLFQFQHLKNTYNTLMEKRVNYGREIILLSALASFLNLVTVFGESAIKYMSLIKQFNWEIGDYTLYSTVSLAAIFSVSFFGLWIGNSLLKIPDHYLLLTAFFTKAISTFLMAMSTNKASFYASTMIGCLRGFIGPLTRSQATYIVPQKDVGKVFSFIASIECLTPQIGFPIYCTIYAAIVAVSPLHIYFVSSSIYCFGILVILLIVFLKNIPAKEKKTTILVDDNIIVS